MSAYSASLIESNGTRPFEAAIGWVNAVLIGELAVGLCVMAVAIIGLLMLTGRLPVRKGARVILGCFVLLGAPAIAGELMQVWPVAEPAARPVPMVVEGNLQPREELPPATYNPYTSATMRTD